jgi:hypothetical protein
VSAASGFVLDIIPGLVAAIAAPVLIIAWMRNLIRNCPQPFRAALRTTTNLLGQLTIAAVFLVMVAYSYPHWYKTWGLAGLLALVVGSAVVCVALIGLAMRRYRDRRHDT